MQVDKYGQIKCCHLLDPFLVNLVSGNLALGRSLDALNVVKILSSIFRFTFARLHVIRFLSHLQSPPVFGQTKLWWPMAILAVPKT